MAPEIITQSHTPTTASDIWSIGCTLIELLTGYPPYFDMVAMSAIYKMVNDGCPPLPDDISEDTEDFLRKCFIFDPDERPSAKDLLNHPWIVSHVPELAKKETLPDLDQVRDTVKKFTLSKEQGLIMKQKLSDMHDEDTSGTEEPVIEEMKKSKSKKSKKKDSHDEGLFDMGDLTTSGKRKLVRKNNMKFFFFLIVINIFK